MNLFLVAHLEQHISKINLYRLLFQMLKKQNLHINQNNPLIKTEPIQAINLFLLKKTS